MSAEELLNKIEWYIEAFERDWYDRVGTGNLVDRLRVLLTDADAAYQLRYTKKRQLIVERDQWMQKANHLSRKLADISPALLDEIGNKMKRMAMAEDNFLSAVRDVMGARYEIARKQLDELKDEPPPEIPTLIGGNDE